MSNITVKLLLLCLISTTLLQAVACQSAGTGTQTTDTSAPETQPETEKPFLDNLGEHDFGGADFTLLVRTDKLDAIAPEEENGEVLNDALYQRNAKAAERFNVNIVTETLESDGGVWNKALEGEVMSGGGSYDVVMPDYWWGCETHGYYLNLLDYDQYLDFDQPWWSAGWNDNAEIYGQLYGAVGTLSLDLIQNQVVIYYNKVLAESLKIDDLYTLVENKQWTLDKLLEYSALALNDVNGDGAYTIQNDSFGFGFALQAGRALLTSSGMKIATKTADGEYAYDFFDDKFVSLYDRIYAIVNNTPSVFYSKDNSDLTNTNYLLEAFKNDRMLFFGEGLGHSEDLRDMKSDFGIIPYPLYDENQPNYITYNYGTSYMSILLTAKDPVMSAVMLEALNAESYHSVLDTYFETTLKNKYSRDGDSGKMLDLINNNSFFDFTFVNETSTDHIVMSFFASIEGKQANIASIYEGKKAAYEAKLKTLLETYKENGK